MDHTYLHEGSAKHGGAVISMEMDLSTYAACTEIFSRLAERIKTLAPVAERYHPIVSGPCSTMVHFCADGSIAVQ